jgi:hypothetical protein
VARSLGFALLLPLLAACGDDGPEPAVASLAAMHDALETGRGLDAAGWTATVQRAAVDLWPGTGEADVAAQSSRKIHSDLAYIAGDVARRIAKDPAERAAIAETDALSLEVRDGLGAASKKGPDAYRAWIAKEGTALRARRIEALSEPPPR